MQCMKEHDGVHMYCHQQTKVQCSRAVLRRASITNIIAQGLSGVSNGERSYEKRGMFVWHITFYCN